MALRGGPWAAASLPALDDLCKGSGLPHESKVELIGGAAGVDIQQIVDRDEAA
jgi:hypothetical protein